MARPTKIGLDYFELDCHMDEKVELIEAEYGLKGFAILVKLYQSIYSGFGYYCEWTPDISVLWARRLGVAHGVDSGNLDFVDDKSCALPGFPNNLINNVVAASIRRNIFSEELFNEYRILTSSGIQKRYLNAVSRREKVELKKEYLLISVGKNAKNVVINSISVDRNKKNVGDNTQRRVEKSRVNKSNNILCAPGGTRKASKQEIDDFFEKVWKLYPSKKGKGQISDAKKRKLYDIGFEELARAIERYKQGLEVENWRKPQNGSTFFNSGYIDYLDANYEESYQSNRQRARGDRRREEINESRRDIKSHAKALNEIMAERGIGGEFKGF